jgi:hypothetical protein
LVLATQKRGGIPRRSTRRDELGLGRLGLEGAVVGRALLEGGVKL